jgi:hypothetical protein
MMDEPWLEPMNYLNSFQSDIFILHHNHAQEHFKTALACCTFTDMEMNPNVGNQIRFHRIVKIITSIF